MAWRGHRSGLATSLEQAPIRGRNRISHGGRAHIALAPCATPPPRRPEIAEEFGTLTVPARSKRVEAGSLREPTEKRVSPECF